MNGLLKRWRPELVPKFSPSLPAAAAPAMAAPSAGSARAALQLGAGARLTLAERFDGDSAQVDGELSGSLRVKRFLLGRGGVLRGHVSCDSAQIRGRFEGELIVAGKLVVFAGAQVEGKVRFGEVQVWKGGSLSGNVMHHEEASRSGPPQRQRGALFLPTRAVLSSVDGGGSAD